MVRWSHAYKGEGVFPHTLGGGEGALLAAMRAPTPAARKATAQDGTEYDFTEAAMQRTASKNPVACAVMFQHLIENVRQNLLGATQDRLMNEPLPEREKGVFGVAACNRDVKECSARGAFHVHGQHHGGATPALIAHVADDAELSRKLLDGLDTQARAPPAPLARPALARPTARAPSRR